MITTNTAIIFNTTIITFIIFIGAFIFAYSIISTFIIFLGTCNSTTIIIPITFTTAIFNLTITTIFMSSSPSPPS